MVALDYKVILDQQYAGTKWDFYKVDLFSFLARFPKHLILSIAEAAIKRLNKSLTSQLVFCKGVLKDIQDSQEDLKNHDLNKDLKSMSLLIKRNTTLLNKIEELPHSDASSIFTGLNESIRLLEEIVEVLYDCDRLLRRLNKKATHQTSDLAKYAVAVSADTMNKVLYAR